MLFGWALAGIGQLEGAPGGLIGGKGPPCADIRAQGFNWDLWKRSQTSGNGWKRTQTDANGWKQTQTQAGSGAKIYLKAKTYD